jgi:hypothetical protein
LHKLPIEKIRALFTLCSSSQLFFEKETHNDSKKECLIFD